MVAPVLRTNVSKIVAKRAFSMTSVRASGHGHSHEEHHDHHEDHGHGHGHGHGPDLAAAESPFTPTLYFIGAMVTGVLGTYYVNKSYASSHDGKTLLNVIMGDIYTIKETEKVTESYRQAVTSTQTLFQKLQFNQPKRAFHEFTYDRIVPVGSERSVIPGTLIDVESVGPRRERVKIFKDL